MFAGTTITLQRRGAGIVELRFDAASASVNTFNTETLGELKTVLDLLTAASDIRGCLITSGKPMFIVGADITEFQHHFRRDAAELKAWVLASQALFNQLENLPFPTLAAINGMALGGGFELALAADVRVLADDTRVGLPEVGLGICPGWGGTVRLSRLLGAEAALDWMLDGKPRNAAKALAAGAVDQVASADQLYEQALATLQRLIDGEIDYRPYRQRKQSPVSQEPLEHDALQAGAAQLHKKLDTRYPAAGAILDSVVRHINLPFTQALEIEADCFVELARGDVAASLVGLFMNDQLLKKQARHWCKQANPVKQAAVLGAGIMGGGIAYQSASSGIPIRMKDIRTEALDLGFDAATRLLDKQVERGRLDESGKAKVLAGITPSLDYNGFDQVDLVVEAVVENPAIKASVLAEVEQQLPADAVLASNTSTISIDQLARGLERPQQLCGMHFFNPVHQMPLVEVIRGSQTSDATIARTVAYATALGKTPIVVNDCPGFLVNRILFPYFNGFNRLLLDGVDFQRIDRVMEAFGWPMGPGYLADVVGIDTMVHADQVLQAGFPERMLHDGEVIMEGLLAAGCLGQKNGQGFYLYGVDDNGRRFKEPNGQARELQAACRQAPVEVSDAEIIERLMVPLCLEAVRCLEDGIVGSAAEVDMGLVLGLGFPRFRGGPLRHIQTLGLEVFCEQADRHLGQGELNRVTDELRQRAAESRPFYA
ncbi:fatty acid oxidation complex subunit alpha FadB [Marinobacterium maritimum]|uniref:enoyl-CoA hydratase n=1 Tax=Marinobacterium maritimum TaxID=500162 RepID=A0ABN1I736_9GAMM